VGLKLLSFRSLWSLRRRGIFIVANDFFDLTQPVLLEIVHGRIQVARLAAAPRFGRCHLPLSALMWMEVHSPEVTGGIVALIVPLASLACFAIGKEGLVVRRVERHPDFASLLVDAVCMATQLVLATKAIRVVIADAALESRDPPWRRLQWCLEGR
jgi:hypothetical protein